MTFVLLKLWLFILYWRANFHPSDQKKKNVTSPAAFKAKKWLWASSVMKSKNTTILWLAGFDIIYHRSCTSSTAMHVILLAPHKIMKRRPSFLLVGVPFLVIIVLLDCRSFLVRDAKIKISHQGGLLWLSSRNSTWWIVSCRLERSAGPKHNRNMMVTDETTRNTVAAMRYKKSTSVFSPLLLVGPYNTHCFCSLFLEKAWIPPVSSSCFGLNFFEWMPWSLGVVFQWSDYVEKYSRISNS